MREKYRARVRNIDSNFNVKYSRQMWTIDFSINVNHRENLKAEDSNKVQYSIRGPCVKIHIYVYNTNAH